MAAQAAFQPSRRPKSGYSEYIEPPLRSPDDSKRASIVSSTTNGGASDFETAPNTPYEGSEQGSEHTVAGARDPDLEPSPVDGPTINPIHILATQSGNPEAHVVKVSKDRVVIREGPPSEPFVQRVTHAIENYGLPPPTTTAHLPSQAQAVYKPSTATVAQGEFGPTPPATPPPAAHNLPQTDVSPVPSYFTQKHSSQKSEGNAETTSSPPIPQPSSSPPPIHQRRSPPQKSFTQPPHLIEMQRATTFAGAGTLTSSPIAVSYSEPLPSGSSPRGLGQGSTSSNGSIAKHLSYLEAPAITVTRPTRRNTISSPRPSRSLQETHAQLTQVGPGGSAFENGEIEEDILLMADQIRRERRRKAAHEKELERQEAEEMKEVQIQRRLTMDDKPLVGNLVGINHVNYVLMYNMLTGIRVAVSRCQAKIVRPLTEDDFTSAHKYSFDITGSELTPSAKYDFKFKDYAPWVFRSLREDSFHLDPADYLLSLTAKYILSELGTPGKSGSFFYFSRDYRFIIKTIHAEEHKFLRKILKRYYEHVKANPHTLLSRFYGLHRVKLPRGKKIHFVIMNNLFPPHKDIHETYDLKGSTVGRTYPVEKAKENPRAVLKDNNWLLNDKTLELGPEKRAFLTMQIERDVKFLEEIQVMDYSLLVGIHHVKRGNRDNLRKNTLKLFSAPDIAPRKRKTNNTARALRRAMAQSQSHSIQPAELEQHASEALNEMFIFYSEDGGYRATDELDQEMDTIYYFGIIDICTHWGWKKWAEGVYKGIKDDWHKISPVKPTEYGERFKRFMGAIMRGGERKEFLDEKIMHAKVE